MTTYLAVSWCGKNTHISAYTYSDAYQQACDWAEPYGGIRSFNAI